MDPKLRFPVQAVVVRYLHDAGVGESLNVGVVLLCEKAGFAGARFLSSWSRITAAFHDADAVHLRRFVRALEDHCDGYSAVQMPIDRADVVAFVREVLPPADQGLMLSAPISGLAADPERLLGELYERYVGQHVDAPVRVARADDDVWRSVSTHVPAHLLVRLRPHIVSDPDSPVFRLEFKHAWRNAGMHVVQPLSFDLASAENVQQKASQWIGNIIALEPKRFDTSVHIVVGFPARDQPRAVTTAAHAALELLDRRLRNQAVEVLKEDSASALASRILQDLNDHPDETKLD